MEQITAKGDFTMLEKRIDAAVGNRKAETVLKNATFVNVFTGELQKGDIALDGGKIVGFGDYEGVKEYDLTGKIAVPGLIDAHVHVESSQLSPEEYAKIILPRGTTTIIADPHEITNVCGIAGAKYISDACANTPLEAKVMLPSCVPATGFETSGAVLTGADTEKYIREGFIHGLGEFMNYPGVIYKDKEALKKLESAIAAGKVIDGHAPDTSGKGLNGYICAGIQTDHECTSQKEALEKISKGMYVHLREGSATRNVAENCKAVNAANLRRFIFCTDDRHAADLKANGHLDNALRIAVAAGMDPVWAVIAATLNSAECYRLYGKGAIAPGYDADIAVFDDLKDFNCAMTFKAGKLVAKDGKALFATGEKFLPEVVKNTVHVGKVSADDFKIALKGKKANVIHILKDGVVTKKVVREVESKDGDVVLEGTDLCKIAVVERHHGTGNIGLGLVEGYGLHGGALAITIAHDSHNVIVLGDSGEAMAKAVEEIKRIGGGMVAVKGDQVYSLPLDIAGLMSSLSAEEYIARSEEMLEIAYSMGVSHDYEAFMSLSFMALVVIPEIKLSDKGLFDVTKFALCGIDAE